jgi:hypothetical protein
MCYVSAVQDFTIYPMGRQVEGELIVVCPYCHRSAVRRSGDMIQFVHQIRITQEGKTSKLNLDSCPKENGEAH